MHTVRNRVASRPRPPRSSGKGKVPRSKAPLQARGEPSFLLRQPNPPAFPEHLILPVRRGAVISSVPWPEAAALPAKPAARKSAKSATTAKPRKVAKGKSAAAKRRPPSSSRKVRSNSASPRPAKTSVPTPSESPPSMPTIDLLDRALAMEPELPMQAESPPPATSSPVVAETTPLPRSRALAHPRGSGLLDAIGHWLRDAARRFAVRHGLGLSRHDRARLARANARQRALQSQFEALDALRESAIPPGA